MTTCPCGHLPRMRESAPPFTVEVNHAGRRWDRTYSEITERGAPPAVPQ